MNATLFADRRRIAAEVARVASEIDRDHAGTRIVLAGVLKGSLPFLADVARACSSEIEIDLLAISQFGQEAKQGGVVRIVKDLDTDLHGRSLVLVEDIVDTGLTLGYLRRMLAARGPSSIRVATLLDRKSARADSIAPDYAALEAPDGFLVGYGLDVEGRFRNLRNLWLLERMPGELTDEDVAELHERDSSV